MYFHFYLYINLVSLFLDCVHCISSLSRFSAVFVASRKICKTHHSERMLLRLQAFGLPAEELRPWRPEVASDVDTKQQTADQSDVRHSRILKRLQRQGQVV